MSLWHASPPKTDDIEEPGQPRKPGAHLKPWAQRVLISQLNVTGIPEDWRALDAAIRSLSGYRLPPCAPGCEIGEYNPDVVRYRLNNFLELVAACNGMSAAGAEPISSAGEVDARRDQIAMLADIKDGTDERGYDRFGCPRGLGDILHWRSVARIYRRQERFAEYLAMRANFQYRDDLAREPADPAVAEGVCIDRISRALGWFPHRCGEV